ncbi:radical SAM protein [Paenibacillus tritici]|uniref:radical SAM/SPASM domain-containing protein n=1 Tax=Paenibacillus tritici TaxID=1873425 RepID=UPI001BA9078A|nr:radical SAM protein [Paenibacillus tritici]QUL56256.1 radical SAM protein [Paenibacillus tritici]
MNLSENCKILFNTNRVVILNRENGAWMRISKECYDILEESIRNNESQEELLMRLYDDEDRTYFKKILDKLDALGVLDPEHKKWGVNDVSIYLTNRCNLKCSHCIVDASTINECDKYNTEEIYRIIDKVSKTHPKNITFSGGEVMVRKDFFDIIEYAKRSFDGEITIMTNGTLINEQNIKKLVKNVNYISISMDGIDEDSCSIIRGKGVFSKVMRSISLLHNENFHRISLSMVLTKNNENLINGFFELNKRLNTKPMLRALAIEGRAKKNVNSLMKNPNVVSNPVFSDTQEPKDKVGCSCKAGITEFTIDCNGDIYPCDLFVEKSFKLGSVDEFEDLTLLFNNTQNSCIHPILSDYNPENYLACKDCDVNYFCWRCPHDLYSLKDDITAFTERCEFMKPRLRKVIWAEEAIS